MYSREGLIEAVYDCIRNSVPLEGNVQIPHSDVFFVREALENRFTDRTFTLQEVEEYMRTELNWTDSRDADN